MNSVRILLALLSFTLLLTGFLNCSSRVDFNSPSSINSNSSSALGSPTGGQTVTGKVVQAFEPVFAVRGANCLVCHGEIGSNLITDFGYGSANFITGQSFWGWGGSAANSYGRTAFNDGTGGNDSGTWESLTVSGGSIFVPKITVSAQAASTMFGLNTIPLSMADIMNLANPNGYGPMSQGVMPPPGQPAVGVYSSIKISYPSQSEILALLPGNSQPNSQVAVAVAQGGSANSQIQGLVADVGGGFIRNSAGQVICYGDVVVKGPLFLNNLQLMTDAEGCRLYVSQTVFIQGPITYTGAANSNLQISSARAVIMGFSAERMGAASLSSGGTAPAAPSTNRTNNSVLTTPGGPWPRFAVGSDSQYNPGLDDINGVNPTAFFDGLVADALVIGPELQDAGDPTAIGSATSIQGESVVNEGGDYPGSRLAINYSGLLLNAPHVHSRYAGTFSGIVIADVAMMARNPSSTAVFEQFTYDPRFSTVTSILPALSTIVLNVTP